MLGLIFWPQHFLYKKLYKNISEYLTWCYTEIKEILSEQKGNINMVTELIAVGTEILLGNIVNTNSAYLSEKCAELGLAVYYQSVVGDNPDRMKSVIKTALDRSDVIILTGGLGPTEDDLTKEITVEVMGFPLVEDAHTRELMEAYLKEYEKNHPQRRITKNN